MKSVLRTALFSIFSVVITASSLPAQNANGAYRGWNSSSEAHYQVVSSHDGDRGWDRDHRDNRGWNDRDRDYGRNRDYRGGYGGGYVSPGYYQNGYYDDGRYRDHDNHAGRSAAVIGGSAAAGALIGAAAGHGQGAAIGAIVGGVAGVFTDQAIRSHDHHR